MPLKTRRFLFFTLLVLFLFVGTAVVLWSDGWRLSWSNCEPNNWFEKCILTPRKIGGVFIKTKPTGVDIKLNGENFKDESGLVQSGTLISELKPGPYLISISKNGYREWNKKIEVKPSLVSKAENVILLPLNVEKEAISLLRLRGEKIEALSPSGDKIVIVNTQSGNYYLYDLTDKSTAFNINLNFSNLGGAGKLKKIAFHPFNSAKLIVETSKGLYILDTSRAAIEKLASGPIGSWSLANPNIFYLSQKAQDGAAEKIKSFNLILKTERDAFILPAAISKNEIKEIAVSGNQDKLAALSGSGDLYLIGRGDEGGTLIARNAAAMEFSPDGKKIAFWDSNLNLRLFFLEDWPSDNYKQAGDTTRFSLKDFPRGIQWYKDSAHLFLIYPNAVIFREIDDRPPENDYPLIKGEKISFRYSQNSNLLYFIEANQFYRFSLE